MSDDDTAKFVDLLTTVLGAEGNKTLKERWDKGISDAADAKTQPERLLITRALPPRFTHYGFEDPAEHPNIFRYAEYLVKEKKREKSIGWRMWYAAGVMFLVVVQIVLLTVFGLGDNLKWMAAGPGALFLLALYLLFGHNLNGARASAGNKTKRVGQKLTQILTAGACVSVVTLCVMALRVALDSAERIPGTTFLPLFTLVLLVLLAMSLYFRTSGK